MKRSEGLLSTNFQVIGRSPLKVRFTNSSRNPRTIEVQVGKQKPGSATLLGHTMVELLLVDGTNLVAARQNVGNEVLFQGERHVTPPGAQTESPIPVSEGEVKR